MGSKDSSARLVARTKTTAEGGTTMVVFKSDSMQGSMVWATPVFATHATPVRPAIEIAGGQVIFLDQIEGGLKDGEMLSWEMSDKLRLFVNGVERRILDR